MSNLRFYASPYQSTKPNPVRKLKKAELKKWAEPKFHFSNYAQSVRLDVRLSTRISTFWQKIILGRPCALSQKNAPKKCAKKSGRSLTFKLFPGHLQRRVVPDDRLVLQQILLVPRRQPYL